MSSLQPGQSYKLSLLFHEQCCSRGFDIFVGGAAVVEAYSPQVEQGGVSEAGRPGALVTYSFAAQSAQLAVELQSTPDDEVSTTARWPASFLDGLRLSHGWCFVARRSPTTTPSSTRSFWRSAARAAASYALGQCNSLGAKRRQHVSSRRSFMTGRCRHLRAAARERCLASSACFSQSRMQTYAIIAAHIAV